MSERYEHECFSHGPWSSTEKNANCPSCTPLENKGKEKGPYKLPITAQFFGGGELDNGHWYLSDANGETIAVGQGYKNMERLRGLCNAGRQSVSGINEEKLREWLKKQVHQHETHWIEISKILEALDSGKFKAGE